MTLARQEGVVALHAGAVVAHLDEVGAPCLDVDLDARRARIERVLHQLLHDRRGPLDDFARRDLAGDLGRQDADAAHDSGLGRRRRANDTA